MAELEKIECRQCTRPFWVDQKLRERIELGLFTGLCYPCEQLEEAPVPTPTKRFLKPSR